MAEILRIRRKTLSTQSIEFISFPHIQLEHCSGVYWNVD